MEAKLKALDAELQVLALTRGKTDTLLYKLLFLGHRSLIKKITQTAVINIPFSVRKKWLSLQN